MAVNLPQFVFLSSSPCNGKYLSFIEGIERLQFPGEENEVLVPLNNRMGQQVDLRGCCSCDKKYYWAATRPSAESIAAAAASAADSPIPILDQRNSSSCALLKPVFVSSPDPTLRFLHVPARHYHAWANDPILNSCLCNHAVRSKQPALGCNLVYTAGSCLGPRPYLLRDGMHAIFNP